MLCVCVCARVCVCVCVCVCVYVHVEVGGGGGGGGWEEERIWAAVLTSALDARMYHALCHTTASLGDGSFASLRNVSKLVVSSNRALELSNTDFSNIRALETLTISETATGLSNGGILPGFSLLESVSDTISISNNDNITSLRRAFPFVRELGGFSATGNLRLTVLPALDMLERTGTIVISSNQALTEVDEFSFGSLVSAVAITVWFNPSLVAMTAFDGQFLQSPCATTWRCP